MQSSPETRSDPPVDAEHDEECILVQQMQQGDVHAFEELFRVRYTPIRLFLTYMVGNKEVANDLTQETFLKAWYALPGLRDPARFDSWLYSIARRFALSYLRRERLLNWLPWNEHEQSQESSEMESFEHTIAERALLIQALAQVKPRYRDCLILQLVHRMPQRQIADLLALRREYVSTYVQRGLVQLQRAYQQLEQE